MAKSLKQIAKQISDFADSRGWKNDEPNHLITSLMIELSELAEYFQWKKSFPEFSNDERKAVAFELVDVLVYMLQIANKSGIKDLEPYFLLKMEKLGEKFAIGADWHTVHEGYRKSGKNKFYD
ncbi:MAG: hypothetical protein JNK26_00795 [Candidatus Doudnabacteria bacterium]|nr:hypothetical protein [Candidatus Doudnabacteria bacterium]